MSHPLDEVQHTPWGQKVEGELDVLRDKTAKHEERFIRHDVRLDKHDTRLEQFGRELASNTLQTNSIKADTVWLVDMFKGSKALGRVLAVLVIIVTGAIVIYDRFWPHK